MSSPTEYSHSPETYSSTPTSSSNVRKKKSNNKKRFSDEQIKSLESMFGRESRLDPAKKLELASNLGLHPRQVAIWFQNRRARSKPKQLQRHYSLLESGYASLVSKFQALKNENHALLLQLQKLKDLQGQTFCCKGVKDERLLDPESDIGETIKSEQEVKPSPSMERSEHLVGVVSDGDSRIKAEYFGLEDEPTLLNFVDEHPDGSLTSPEDWGKLESADDLSAQSDGSYQWGDFWS